MITEPRRHHRLFAEMKRRKVFRVAALYGLVAFGVIQVAEPLRGALHLPDSFLSLVVGLLLLGFPVAVVLAWAFDLTPEGMRRTVSAEPGEIEAIVAEPALRRWPSGVFALVGITAMVSAAWVAGRRSAGAMDGESVEASIAVLPFVNMSTDADQEFFSEGISEELLNMLAKIPELRVAARTSSFAFKGQDLGIPDIGRRLNVAHVLEGSVRKSQDRVRITAQLIRTQDGFHLWSETWDRNLLDVFAVQDEIAADVVAQLRGRLLGVALPTSKEVDPEVYSLVLRARQVSELRTREHLLAADSLYREALARDSTYAAAWEGLAVNNYRRQGSLGFDPDARMPASEEAARRALALDPNAVGALVVLARVQEFHGNLAESASLFSRALESSPGDAVLVGAAGAVLLNLGRPHDAARFLEYQVARDPVNAAAWMNLARAYVAAGRTADGVRAARSAIALGPERGSFQGQLARALLHDGRPQEALEAVEREVIEFWQAVAAAMVYHALGQADRSDEAMALILDRYARTGSYNAAYAAAYRGEVDRAFALLDDAVEFGDGGLTEVLGMREFNVLHADPRWPRFLERIGRSPEDVAAVRFDVQLPN